MAMGGNTLMMKLIFEMKDSLKSLEKLQKRTKKTTE